MRYRTYSAYSLYILFPALFMALSWALFLALSLALFLVLALFLALFLALYLAWLDGSLRAVGVQGAGFALLMTWCGCRVPADALVTGCGCTVPAALY